MALQFLDFSHSSFTPHLEFDSVLIHLLQKKKKIQLQQAWTVSGMLICVYTTHPRRSYLKAFKIPSPPTNLNLCLSNVLQCTIVNGLLELLNHLSLTPRISSYIYIYIYSSQIVPIDNLDLRLASPFASRFYSPIYLEPHRIRWFPFAVSQVWKTQLSEPGVLQQASIIPLTSPVTTSVQGHWRVIE